MNKTLAARAAPALQAIQPSFPKVEIASRAVLEDSDRHPEASIKGDLGIIVTEQEVARGPITGRYTVSIIENSRRPLMKPVWSHTPTVKYRKKMAHAHVCCFEADDI